MPKPPLSMKPTGWFQVAWSADVPPGQVRRMTYFGVDLVAWRSGSGRVVVMEAYCGHLGAHLGYGGRVEGERIVCPFHGWEWSEQGRNVCIPYQKHPNRGRRVRTFPVTELNECIFVWHDVEGRAPYFDVPDVFAGFGDGSSAAAYYPAHPSGTLHHERLQVHPQYVMENGVDFAHFEYVHKVPAPTFTRHDYDGPVAYVDFTVDFGEAATTGSAGSGVEAINAGLGAAVTKSWGMIDNRTLSAVTPVDDATSDVRFTVWIGRLPGDRSADPPTMARRLAQAVIEQFQADVDIWRHQRYSDPPSLAAAENEGFRALRAWATQFYPDSDNFSGRTGREVAQG